MLVIDYLFAPELKHLVEIHGKNSAHKNQEPLNYDEVLIVQVIH